MKCSWASTPQTASRAMHFLSVLQTFYANFICLFKIFGHSALLGGFYERLLYPPWPVTTLFFLTGLKITKSIRQTGSTRVRMSLICKPSDFSTPTSNWNLCGPCLKLWKIAILLFKVCRILSLITFNFLGVIWKYQVISSFNSGSFIRRCKRTGYRRARSAKTL